MAAWRDKPASMGNMDEEFIHAYCYKYSLLNIEISYGSYEYAHGKIFACVQTVLYTHTVQYTHTPHKHTSLTITLMFATTVNYRQKTAQSSTIT